MAVLVIGTLDTKGEELAFVQARLQQAGVEVVLVDVGTGGPPRGAVADVSLGGGFDDRGEAVAAMARAAAELTRRLHAQGRVDGVLGAGGSGNTAIATAAMRASDRGSEADGLDDGRGRHERLRGRHRHHDDGLGD
jgi:uncharacterized protein (UPF0261 family)